MGGNGSTDNGYIALGGLTEKNLESLLYKIYRNSPVNWDLRLIGTKCLEPMCPN